MNPQFSSLSTVLDQIGIWKCWVLRREKTGVPGKKQMLPLLPLDPFAS